MKRIIYMMLAGMMILFAAGCGNKETEKATVQKETTVQEETTKEESDLEGISNTGTHVIVDHLGYEVEVPYEIDRIAVGNILPIPSVLTVFFSAALMLFGEIPTSFCAESKNTVNTLGIGKIFPTAMRSIS